MITRTQVTLCVYGTHFTPSKVAAKFSSAHDPGALGTMGRYRGVPIPYGSAEFDAPEAQEKQIEFVFRLAAPFVAAMRAAGAESLLMHITYHFAGQCAIELLTEELKMVSGLQCDLVIDCFNAEGEPDKVNGGGDTNSEHADEGSMC